MGLIDLSGRSKAWERIEEANRVRSCPAPARGELTGKKQAMIGVVFEAPRSLKLGRRRCAFLRRRQSGQAGLQLVEFLLLIANLLLHAIQLLFS